MTNTFTFNNNVKETCKSYTYFGFLISNNGHIKLNISELSWFTSKVKIAEIVGINQDNLGESKNHIELLRNNLKKFGTAKKKNTVRVN